MPPHKGSFRPGHAASRKKKHSLTHAQELKRDLDIITSRAAKSRDKSKNSGTSVIATYACFLKYVDANKQQLLARAVKMASDGDVYMLRFVLERALPKVTDSVIPIKIDTSGTLTDVATRVIKHVGDQELTPDQGVRVMQLLKLKAELIESDAITKRLKALEEQVGIKPVAGTVVEQERDVVKDAVDEIAKLKDEQHYDAEDDSVFSEEKPSVPFAADLPAVKGKAVIYDDSDDDEITDYSVDSIDDT